MIAQVLPSKGPTGPMSDEMRKFVEETMSGARTHDGVEGQVSIMDPATGEGMAIILCRDQAALDAFQAYTKEKIAEAGEHGVEVPAGRVYTEVIAAL